MRGTREDETGRPRPRPAAGGRQPFPERYDFPSGEPGRPNTADLLFANQTVIGYHLGRALNEQPMKVMGAVPELTQLLGDGTLEVQVGHTFDLAEAAEAHQFIEDRKSSGKVVLVP